MHHSIPLMSRVQRVLLCMAILCASATGCMSPAKNLNATKMGPPYEITAFEKGKPTSHRKLKAMSADEQSIAQWIEANRHGWRPTFSDEAPKRVVKGEGFTLNFTDDKCIMFIPPDPKSKDKRAQQPIRLSKKLTPGDIELAQALDGTL